MEIEHLVHFGTTRSIEQVRVSTEWREADIPSRFYRVVSRQSNRRVQIPSGVVAVIEENAFGV